MLRTPRLTIAYIKKRPESAGRVLAAMPAADAAAFLEQIPVRFAVQAMAPMNPRAAASTIQEMDMPRGAAILRELSFAEASTILRQISPATRGPYLAEQPGRRRRNFEMTLAFPPGTVGAHMTTVVLMTTATETASSALNLVKKADRDNIDVVFVVDDDKKLLGAVNVTTLVRQPSRTPLGNILDTSCAVLSARSALYAISNLDAWHDYNRLPVVNRRGQVIGVLAHTALRRVDQNVPTDAEPGSPALLDSLVVAFGASCVGLVNMLIAPSGGTDAGRSSHGR